MTEIARRLHALPDSPYPTDEKVAALTFDDAPGPNTAPVLDALAALGVTATFFVVGRKAERAPELLRRIVDEGHVIGNHSYEHTALGQMSDTAIRDDFARTGDIVAGITGVTMERARPPYSMSQASRLAMLLDPLGYSAVVGWSIDPRDWEGHDATAVTDHVVEQLHPCAIVLLHAGSGRDQSTAAAIPPIVKAARVLGYRLVTC
ncbi:MAG: polysaccharide deacetylase family protein [Acidimicrobiia bacterium]